MGGGGLTINTSTITGGTSGRVLFNNAGTVGEKAVTGTGSVVLSASPTITGNPIIGNQEAASIAIGSPSFDSEITPSTTEIGGNLQITGDPTLQTASSNLPFTFNSSLTANERLDLVGGTQVGLVQNLATAQTSGTFNFLTSQTSTILNIGGANATGAINIGGVGSTGNINIGRSSGAQTVNIATIANASGVTKTLNIGTNGAAGSTTNITIGATAGTSTTTLNGNIIMSKTATPASATATGTAGTIVWDADYIYVCTATNAWKRTAITTW